MRAPRLLAAGLATVGLTLGAVAGTSSCAQTPVNVPVRSFDRAQKMDVVCMNVEHYDPVSGYVTEVYPTPLPQEQCPPVPVDVDGTLLDNHLFALVTQQTRGEVAVVDLTAGNVVDIDISTPGINFLTVGKNPTDIASTPDGKYSFVASAEVAKPALYAIDSRRILGDARSAGFDPTTTPTDPTAPAPNKVPTLTTWPACSLPGAPGSITIVPAAQISGAPTGDADAGASDDGGTDGGGVADGGTSGTGSQLGDYTIAVVIPGDEVQPAQLLTLDPHQLVDGSIPPGSLAPCHIESTVTLAAPTTSTWSAGPTWSDGIPFDGGFGEPSASPPLDAGASDGGDAGSTSPGAGSGTSAGPQQGLGVPPAPPSCASVVDAGQENTLPALPPAVPRGGPLARSGTTIYIADQSLPVIHVIDASNPAAPKELAPLLTTSQLDPNRRVIPGQLAVSPTTRDYVTYLYAIDQKEGSIMVFDVSNPVTSPHVPLTRPHAEVNPFQPPDRITFAQPVASLAFASHDYSPLDGTTAIPRGLLCNPNKLAALQSLPGKDKGTYYRANAPVTDLEGQLTVEPQRLRGVFALATLSNGAVVFIDVDDWDSPCRRPDPMGGVLGSTDESGLTTTTANTKLVSSITPFEPSPLDANDIDPYHAPITFSPRYGYVTGDSTSVTNEAFFPVSAPNRLRSVYPLRRDPTYGVHTPFVSQPPQLFAALTSPVTLDDRAPLMLPTASGLADVTYAEDPTNPNPDARSSRDSSDLSFVNGSAGTKALPNVRVAFEDPTVHQDLSWYVTYEGVLPEFSGTPNQHGISGALTTNDKYSSLVLTAPNPLFCRQGIEDAQVGAERASEYLAAIGPYNYQAPPRLDHRVGDYLQLSEDLLPPDDPYWSEDDSNDPNGTCWDFEEGKTHSDPADRYNTCAALYGNAGDQKTSRDFPIWQAYDDHLVVTRYGYSDANDPTSREIVGPDPSNAGALKAMRCCFHRQVQFHVRTGGAWLTTSLDASGRQADLNHITKGQGGLCQQSCDPNVRLLNSRALGLSRVGVTSTSPAPDRNSPLAMRNPMFAFLMWEGLTPDGKGMILPTRDLQWTFAMSGALVPQVINYAGTTSAAVSPQSMRFLGSFGMVAVVDGAQWGLVLLDLNNITVGRGPYY